MLARLSVVGSLDRPSMESQHYLVLKRKSKETNNCATKISEDDVLRACCEDIMVNFAEKDFEYDSLAITKNFVARRTSIRTI